MPFTGLFGTDGSTANLYQFSGTLGSGTWNSIGTPGQSRGLAIVGGVLLGTMISDGSLGSISSASQSWTVLPNSNLFCKFRKIPIASYGLFGVTPPGSGQVALLSNGWTDNGRLWYGYYGNSVGFKSPGGGGNWKQTSLYNNFSNIQAFAFDNSANLYIVLYPSGGPNFLIYLVNSDGSLTQTNAQLPAGVNVLEIMNNRQAGIMYAVGQDGNLYSTTNLQNGTFTLVQQGGFGNIVSIDMEAVGGR